MTTFRLLPTIIFLPLSAFDGLDVAEYENGTEDLPSAVYVYRMALVRVVC